MMCSISSLYNGIMARSKFYKAKFGLLARECQIRSQFLRFINIRKGKI